LADAPSIYAVIGPTASGKSALAMALARQIGAEILSVDSMQVYRGMDVGTAKPTAAERAEVRHHGLDVAEPTETFTAAKFVALADAAIADARGRGVPLVAVGGTPLYFKTLFEGLFEGPAADAELRARLDAEPLEALYERLRQVDPDATARIHGNDRKRIVRALEVYELTGRPITALQREWGVGRARHAATWVGLSWPDRDALNRRINARVRQMLADGWLDETRGLLARHGTLSRTAGEATGYHELAEHLAGRLALDEATERIKIATRQLARRQAKWFRRFPGVRWVDGSLPVERQVEVAREPAG